MNFKQFFKNMFNSLTKSSKIKKNYNFNQHRNNNPKTYQNKFNSYRMRIINLYNNQKNLAIN